MGMPLLQRRGLPVRQRKGLSFLNQVFNHKGCAMGSHPINLAIRFLLELSALLAMGVWGWRQSEGWFRFLLALGIPVIAAVVWGQ